ncbi:LOW QUALITY PROTEIN: hypothetical protein PRUPE_2G043000 [Prunus persica]|uniref:Rx N-terminal domain-containing protein n=1 Tax=Prunus persica TaxID=3760 RepID=A0A251QAY8_PRUPE|nr:LOW QUALITY PROTEIN: hypothetical protein PRUPE_2G043000 [Prunus persica]
MAGASIGEAFISASIQVLCDRLTSREFIDLFRQKKLDQPLPMKLKVTLLTLNVVLNDAGEKQRENPAVREWLDELKHAVFDAEDLLDEINYEALRCKLEGDGQIDNLTNKSMNVKIQELLQRLEDFVQLKSALGLREEVGRKVSQKLQQLPWFMNLVFMVEMKSKKIYQKCCYPMMQTTLARMLYNDHKVEEHFTLKAWACVSEDSKIDPNMKLLVVTCKNVASVMQNVPIQFLEPLSNEDCWLLLAKHAFGNESSSSHPSLEEIGRQIARKCNGLPLAVQTLGGVLRCKIDSEDYSFKIEDVVFLWMGEGLIPQDENGERMEEVAKEYFDELLSRSLFQKSWKSSFTMHDLINDLAAFMSKGVSYRLEGRESHELERVRYLSYVRGEFDIALKFEPLNEAKCLRTFLPTSLSPYRFYIIRIIKNILQDLVPSLKCLRVLSLSQYQNVTELPDTIENLIHLHYLDLSHTAIRRLPSVLCNLYNLQTLLLSDCSFLVELPTDIRKLINLQKLMLAEMPVEMGRLKSLRTLTGFVVGKSNGLGIGELRELKHLGGKLSILKLQNVVDARDALKANLKHKKDLKELELAWGAEDIDDSQKEKDVLDKLQPCVNLEQLTIKFYGGTNFPNWLGDSSFSNIQVMHLSDCSYCWSMPPVGELPALKELCIKRKKWGFSYSAISITGEAGV